jgi:hypothetical protein
MLNTFNVPFHREAAYKFHPRPFRCRIPHVIKCHWFAKNLIHLFYNMISLLLLGFAVLYMIHYPKIQQKMRDELDDICGDSLPSLAHRSRYVFYYRKENKE